MDYTHSSKFFQIKERIEQTNNIPDINSLIGKLMSIEQTSEVQELVNLCNERKHQIEDLIKEQEYTALMESIAKGNFDRSEVLTKLKELKGYKDSENLIKKYEEEISNENRKEKYEDLIQLFKGAGSKRDYENLLKEFTNLEKYEDSEKYSKKCKSKIDEFVLAENEEHYNKGINLLSENKFSEAKEVFESIKDFKDAKEKYEEACQKINEELKRQKKKKIIMLLIGIGMIAIGFLAYYFYGQTHWYINSEGHWHSLGQVYEHIYDDGVITTSPTCSEQGLRTYKCTVCGEELTESIPTTEHTKGQVSITTKEPTCTTRGIIVYKCSVCGEYEKEFINPKEHEIIDGFCTACGLDYKLYSVGKKGPAGGLIFYDCDADNDSTNNGAGPDGLKSDVCGWRFLEAAPTDIMDNSGSRISYYWGDDGYFGTKTGIGEGKKNTEIIVSKASKSRTNNAAIACLDYEVNGFNDWFLPSKDELKLMNKVLRSGNSYYYWSSSENYGYYGGIDAWYQYFSSGFQGSSYRGSSRYVRAIRAF